MSSRAHFLLIMIVIYQNVCLELWVFLRFFSINFQGQGHRSKVSALDYNGPMICHDLWSALCKYLV